MMAEPQAAARLRHGSLLFDAMSTHTPSVEDLRRRGVALGVRLDVDPTDWEATVEALIERHEEPLRRYHGTAHVAAVLRSLDELAATDEATELAAWFHDAIYDPTASDNEARSAELFTATAQQLGIDGNVASEAHTMIVATAGHQLPERSTPRTGAFLDADLSILGAPAATYDRYAEAIRFEYQHLSDEAFFTGRLGVLSMFADRPDLFFTDRGRSLWDTTARANLAREIDRIEELIKDR